MIIIEWNQLESRYAEILDATQSTHDVHIREI